MLNASKLEALRLSSGSLTYYLKKKGLSLQVPRLRNQRKKHPLDILRVLLVYVYIYIYVYMYTHIRAVLKIRSSGNERVAELKFTLRETFAVSFAGHVHTCFMISRIMLTALFAGHLPHPVVEAFSFVSYYCGTIAYLSRILRRIS